MTVHQFPPSRVMRTAPNHTVGLSPLAFVFFPLRLWMQCVQQWMDIMTDAEPPTSITFHFGKLDRE